MGRKKKLLYHVVETTLVVDEELERIINEEIQRGWNFEGVQFAVKESARRPVMAFLFFTKEESYEGES